MCNTKLNMKIAVFWANTALMMEAVNSSETFVDIYQTTLCNIPEVVMFMLVVVAKASNLKKLNIIFGAAQLKPAGLHDPDKRYSVILN